MTVRPSIAPGDVFGTDRRAVHHACGWCGPNRTARSQAERDADAHVCDPRDVEQTALRAEIARQPVVAAPTEGGWALTEGAARTSR